ncbi:MAG: YaeQ family protein [Porticoccaceae bacterium]
MALKPTIYKMRISLSDLERDYYDNLNLTIALHPSETLERMMARVLALCLHAQQQPVFTKGLSTAEEPDVWAKSLDDHIDLWIDVGEPAADRIKKASRIAKHVCVYSFNSKSAVWWAQSQDKFKSLKVSVCQFPWENIQALAALAQRTMDMSVTLSGNTVYIAAADGECEVPWVKLQE